MPSKPPPSLAIRHHAYDAAVVPTTAHLEAAVLVPGRRGRVLGGGAPERWGTVVADARGQRRVAAGVDARVAAGEGDVGVAEDGDGRVAVVEAAGQGAEARTGGAGVAVGEPGDVLAVGARGGVGADVDGLEGRGEGEEGEGWVHF